MLPTLLDANMYACVDAAQAKYVLVETYHNDNEELKDKFHMIRTRRVHGTIVTANEIFLGDLAGVYVNVDSVSQFMPRIYKICGAVLIGNYRHEFTWNHDNNWYMILQARGEKIVKENKNKYTYKIKNLNKEKITQWHHQHVLISELFDEINELSGAEAVLAKALDEFSSNEIVHVTFWVYFRAVDEWTRRVFVAMIDHYGHIDQEWLKKEGTYSKQLQSVINNDLSSLFELNVLVNRVMTDVDWEKEKENRTKPKLASFSFDEIYKACFQLFSDAKIEGKKAVKYEYDQYWKQRVILMPGGSVHSENCSDKAVAKALPRPIKSKKGFFAATNVTSHEEWMQRQCEINSYASTKYEWGKVRALYGCDVASHLHADFSMNKCEETFPSYIPTGSKANSEYVEGISKNLKHMIPFCYDYDDFNSQHSVSSMQAAMVAWKKVFGNMLSREQLMSLDWTIKSVSNQFVHNSYTDDLYRTKGTLFSGWRLTTFMNTALNYAYLHCSGLEECVSYSLHNGDDVYAAVKKLGDALRLIGNAEKRNVRAQVTKMNIGTIAEFLRMDFNAKSPTAKQYITRGCATFVHSRIESGSPNSQRSLYQAITTRGDEVIARGGDSKFIHFLMEKQYMFCARLFETDNLIKNLNELDITAGGINSTGNAFDYKIVDEIVSDSDEVDMTMIRRGMKDFVTYICEKMPMMRNKANLMQLEKTIKLAFNVKRTRLVIAQSSKREQMLLMSLKGVWSNLPKIGSFSKARMSTADMLSALASASPVHANVISRSHDPYKYLSVMM